MEKQERIFNYYKKVLEIIKQIVDDDQLNPQDKIRILGMIL